MEILLFLPVKDAIIQTLQWTPTRSLATIKEVWGAKPWKWMNKQSITDFSLISKLKSPLFKKSFPCFTSVLLDQLIQPLEEAKEQWLALLLAELYTLVRLEFLCIEQRMPRLSLAALENGFAQAAASAAQLVLASSFSWQQVSTRQACRTQNPAPKHTTSLQQA